MAADSSDEAGLRPAAAAELKTRGHAAGARPDAPVVELRHVSLAFDEKVVLRDVSFTLLAGHTKLILGASGSGKSTILKLILGLLRPDAGEVYVGGERVDQMAERELLRVRSGLGRVFQEGALFDSLTVGENVDFKLYEEMDRPLARFAPVSSAGVLGSTNSSIAIPDSPEAAPEVAIARAMASKPGILLSDEATTGLDPITALPWMRSSSCATSKRWGRSSSRTSCATPFRRDPRGGRSGGRIEWRRPMQPKPTRRSSSC
jgi:phospholipid/cholesterol/gamma-HCH transport system ATP-binding protein